MHPSKEKYQGKGGEKESDHLIGVTGSLLQRNPRVWSPNKFPPHRYHPPNQTQEKEH